MNNAEKRQSAAALLAILNEVDEQDWLEAKSLRDDTSRSILETVCSLSNEPGLGGGVILLGVAENKTGDTLRYFADGVDDPDKAQLDLATQCKCVFNSPIYPTIKVEKIGGKAVLKVVVDEQPFGRKPVYFKKEGLPKGAYRRIGSADLVATEEDLWRFYEDPESKYDETPGRARGTYYIPSGSLEESIEDEKRKRRSQSQTVTGTPQTVTGTPQAVTGTPQAVTGAPPNENITSLPEALLKELGELKQRTSPQKMKDLVLRLCEVRPMTRDDLMFYLKRGSTTIDNYISLMLGKELDYLYPMMIHHPSQAYVPLGFHHEGTAT